MGASPDLVQIVLTTLTSAYTLSCQNRKGLVLDALICLRVTAGIVPEDVCNTTRRTPEGKKLAKIAISIEGDNLAQRVLRALRDIGFAVESTLPPLPGPGADQTTRLRIRADEGEFGPGAWLYIVRFNVWESSLCATTGRPRAVANDFIGHAFSPEPMGVVERLLAVWRGFDADLLHLEAHSQWPGSGRGGVNAVFHRPCSGCSRSAREFFFGTVDRLVEAVGGVVVEATALDLPDQNVP